MQKTREWVNTWLGAFVGVSAGVLFMAAVTLGYAAPEPQKGKAVEQSTQGQQLCPATPGAGTCKVVLDCPPIKTPGKTTCQATVDCPPAKQPVKPKKKTKTQ
jgi:hypothetical protein